MYINFKKFGYNCTEEPTTIHPANYEKPTQEYEPNPHRTKEENKAREIEVLTRMDKLGMIEWKPIYFAEIFGAFCTVYKTVYGVAYKTVWDNGEVEYYK